MAAEKTHHGYTLEQIMWWVKQLGENFSLRTEAKQFRMIFSHRSCGTQELYGSMWTCAKNAMDALASAVRDADPASLEAFAEAYPESVSA